MTPIGGAPREAIVAALHAEVEALGDARAEAAAELRRIEDALDVARENLERLDGPELREERIRELLAWLVDQPTDSCRASFLERLARRFGDLTRAEAGFAVRTLERRAARRGREVEAMAGALDYHRNRFPETSEDAPLELNLRHLAERGDSAETVLTGGAGETATAAPAPPPPGGAASFPLVRPPVGEPRRTRRKKVDQPQQVMRKSPL